MNELALFAGVGGGILGGKLVGWRTICAVEINKFCAERLMQRQNEGHLEPFPVWDDVCTFDGRSWREIVDVVSGGFPCQPFSTATHGHATAKDFWPEMLRIVKDVEPIFVFAENVSAKAIAKAAEDCEKIGYKTEILCLSAKDVGADHIRKRYWLLAYSDMRDELRSKINAEASQLQNLRPSIWETCSYKSGMDDGVADRLDRFKAIGNGQVPLVAATAWRILLERMCENVEQRRKQREEIAKIPKDADYNIQITKIANRMIRAGLPIFKYTTKGSKNGAPAIRLKDSSL